MWRSQRFSTCACWTWDYYSLLPGEGGGGSEYSSEFSVGVCHPVLQIPTLFQTKTCHFPHSFSDLAKSIPIFRPFCGLITLRFSAKVKNWSNSPENSAWMIYFGYFSFSTIHLELKGQIHLYALVIHNYSCKHNFGFLSSSRKRHINFHWLACFQQDSIFVLKIEQFEF